MSPFQQESTILLQDLDAIVRDDAIPWDELRGKTVFVTGATGLLGGLLVRAMLYANHLGGYGTRIIALVRDVEKAREIFAAYTTCDGLLFLEGDITKPLQVDQSIHYIFHAASVTQSKSFVQSPVETIQTTLWGTDNVLRLAKEHKATSMVYLSTMEVYGVLEKQGQVGEEDFGYLDPMAVRSSYPESKQAAESLCSAYYHEYGVPVKTARLTLTFGPGIALTDNRVFAQFCEKVYQRQDIVLHTAGDTTRDYLYTADAVTALLTILLRGGDGKAYNVANSETYISILDMAKLVARECASDEIKVVVEIPENVQTLGYAPVVKLNLDTRRLEALGWKARTDLPQMYQRLLAYLDEQKA
ncbi:MAG: NAD-dependent epimerase/dehydratase family protein [Pseudomonas sp.]|nr:MAG: NAD-dependent epimerase/dehydratase family protein [Pseudomonas sp.]